MFIIVVTYGYILGIPLNLSAVATEVLLSRGKRRHNVYRRILQL